MLLCSHGVMLRRPRVKHPAEVSKKNKTSENTSISGPEDMETDGGHVYSVEVTLEDTHSDSGTTGNEADVNSALNGILEVAQGGPAGQITHAEAGNNHPERRKRNKRSLIWRHYERLDSLSAARCRICMKKLQCSEGGSTSNLHRHMSKRHPEVFSQLVADGQNQLQLRSSQGSHDTSDVSAPPEAVCTTGRKQFPGSLKVSRVSGLEKRMFRRERELIEALRRAQREEAQALDYQRELLQTLRAANAREAAAERQQIEALRKTQLEEAKDLNRQKEELQKKWEELRREKEQLFLFSSGQQAS